MNSVTPIVPIVKFPAKEPKTLLQEKAAFWRSVPPKPFFISPIKFFQSSGPSKLPFLSGGIHFEEQRFGKQWQQSLLPAHDRELLQECPWRQQQFALFQTCDQRDNDLRRQRSGCIGRRAVFQKSGPELALKIVEERWTICA